MKKKLLSILLALVIVAGLLPTAALAASPTEGGALGEVDIYNGGDELRYLSINGRVQKFLYTYYNFNSKDGTVKEIPAYCVNPNLYGVPQTVPKGQSIKYLASEKASDPKIMGIVANGYPTRGLYELQLDDKEQAYYATKIALWSYILPNWNISNLKLNPALGESEKATAEKILRAAKDIYSRGTAWDKVYEPNFSVVADRDVAYPITIDGKQYIGVKDKFKNLTLESNHCNIGM